MGDDRAVVHLRAGAKYGDDGTQGDELGREGVLDGLHLPDVLLQIGLGGDDLAAVGHRTAAYGQDQVDLVFASELGTLLDLGIGGIGHDARELDDLFALCL